MKFMGKYKSAQQMHQAVNVVLNILLHAPNLLRGCAWMALLAPMCWQPHQKLPSKSQEDRRMCGSEVLLRTRTCSHVLLLLFGQGAFESERYSKYYFLTWESVKILMTRMWFDEIASWWRGRREWQSDWWNCIIVTWDGYLSKILYFDGSPWMWGQTYLLWGESRWNLSNDASRF